MQLRPYQQAAVDAVYEHLRSKETNPCVVIPCGCGKSLVLAQIAKDAVEKWNGRVLLLAHVKELLEQNADKIRKLCPELKIGIYSAGLKSRDTTEQVIVAGIQSVYNKACELDAFDLVIVDECFPACWQTACNRFPHASTRSAFSGNHPHGDYRDFAEGNYAQDIP